MWIPYSVPNNEFKKAINETFEIFSTFKIKPSSFHLLLNSDNRLNAVCWPCNCASPLSNFVGITFLFVVFIALKFDKTL